MNQDNEWKSTDPTKWEPKQEGDSLQGILIDKRARTEDRSAFYHIQDGNDQLHLVWGSAVLDRAMATVEKDDEVRITFNGTKPSKNGKHPMKLFEVMRRKNPNNNVRVTEEKVGGDESA